MPNNLPPDDYAKLVADALEALDAEGLAQIYGFIRARMWWVPREFREYEVEDLMQEALLRTIKGSRNWNQNIPLEVHILGTVKSIVNGLAKKLANQPRTTAFDNRDPHSPGAHDVEMEVCERLARLRKRLAADKVATDVLNSRLDRQDRADACKELRIDSATYDAARKRITREWERLIGNE